MAKKGRKRFDLRRVRISGAVAGTALAANGVTVGAVSSATVNTMRFMTLKASYAWSDIGAIIDDACEFGLAHSDYTATEIKECLEAGASMDLGNMTSREKANRLVRTIGTITGFVGTAAAGAEFNDGKQFKTKLNWKMSIGDTLNLWIRNASGVVWTVGSTVVINGDLWVKDSG